MKKKLMLLVSFIIITFGAISQSDDNTKVFDYSQNKHELAVEIAPIFGGTYPSALFYRKNYIGKNGKTMGFRANMVFQNSFNNNLSFFQNNAYNKSNTLNYGLELGLERQKFLSDKFIGYGGIDAGFFFFNRRFKESTSLQNGNTAFANLDNFTYRLSNFWGMKYHISQRFSFSAETGFQASYNTSVVKTSISNGNLDPVERERGDSGFSFNLIPLRALRVSYHF